MNFKIPQPDDDFDYYGNSSQDESRGSQGTQLFFQLVFFSFPCFIYITKAHLDFVLIYAA